MTEDAETQLTKTVAFRGDVDFVTRPQVLAVLRRALDRGATHIVVDMADVRFLDSSGIGALFEPLRRGARLTVRNPRPAVRRVLELIHAQEAGVVFEDTCSRSQTQDCSTL
jgi:anti-anti-sigma factor